MENLAPHIYRQRLLIEGIYEREVDVDTILGYFDALTTGLGVTAAGEPVVNDSTGKGSLENQGIEAFLPLIESGVALYTWQSSRFLSLIIYTCRAFDEDRAVRITREFFALSQSQHKQF